jgi:hypothetical protein
LVVNYDIVVLDAHVAQQVEHLHGKQEVTGSSPVMGSKIIKRNTRRSFLEFIYFIIKEE